MKIYNEVVTQFNDLTGQWETMYEDSFEYSGDLALMQGAPSNATAINTSDTIADTIKTTAGYFTNGDGTLGGSDIHTGSLDDSNEKYYFNITQLNASASAAETQFSIVFAHAEGSGSDTYGDSSTNNRTLRGETQVIYQQFANLLMTEVEASGGFKIATNGSSYPVYDGSTHTQGLASADARDEYIYAIVGKRSKFKDRFNKKAWTLIFSGSHGAYTTANGNWGAISLTDDSAYVPAVATPGGPRYNIISGSLGKYARDAATDAASVTTLGWFYPEMGIMLFSGHQLSASLPGQLGDADITGSLWLGSNDSGVWTDAKGPATSSGFAPYLQNDRNCKNALKLAQAMRFNDAGTTFRLRSEEDATQENYFCRIRAEEYNFSANPTFTSGSKNKIRNLDMHGNPQTFITGLGLYNSAGQLLAIAKLSSPLKKNFASEATIKVKLTY
jgi:hypothetical protein